MTIRLQIFLAPELQYHPGVGVMIYVMAQVLCISVVRGVLFCLPNYIPSHLLSAFIFLPEGPSLTLSHFSCNYPWSSYCSFPVTCSPHFQGLAIGGVWGVREGARRPLAVYNSRLRINSILNSVTRRGTFIGNSAGVLGLSPCFSQILSSFVHTQFLKHLSTTVSIHL
jgi:hypothetical protein